MRRVLWVLVLAGLIASPVMADKFDDLVQMISNDNFSAFQRFFDRQFSDPNERKDTGDTAITWTAGMADPRYIEYMVSKGGDINAHGGDSGLSLSNPENALATAAWGGNTDLVQWLLDNRISRTYVPNAMWWAAKESNVGPGRILTRYLDDLDMYNETSTYIGVSVNWGDRKVLDFVRMMIEAGADVNAGPDDEYQIMHWAASNEHPELSLYLLGLDTDWERRTHWGTPAIMFAVSGSLPMTRALIEHGVSLDVFDGYSGMSPLHEAVWQNNPYMVQVLVDAGAAVDVQSIRTYRQAAEPYVGITPLDLARRLGRRDLGRIIQGVERVELPDIGLETEAELGMTVSLVRKSTDFLLTDYNGNDSNISDYEGSVVVHNLWASWCPPCVWEMPSLQAVQDQFRSSGLVVVAEATYDERQASLDFISDANLDFDFYFRPDGSDDGRQTGALPSTHIYSRSGLYLGSFDGSREWNSPEMIEYFELITSLSF